MIGISIDKFHKNPSYNDVLSDPRNLPIQTIIQVGTEKLDLTVSHVADEEETQGFMASWSLATKRIELEDAQAREIYD